jgi:hypothetical protein
MESVTHSFTNHYNRCLLNMKFAPLKANYLYILEQPSIVSTATNESILSPLSKQIESFHSPREVGRPTTSLRWLGLVIVSLACPDLAADQRTISNTYKSYRYTSLLKQ